MAGYSLQDNKNEQRAKMRGHKFNGRGGQLREMEVKERNIEETSN